MTPRSPIPSCPRKRESRDFNQLLRVQVRGQALGPAFAGATIGGCRQFDYNLLCGEDEQGGVACAYFRLVESSCVMPVQSAACRPAVEEISEWPVIAAGFVRWRISSRVGAISERRPFSR